MTPKEQYEARRAARRQEPQREPDPADILDLVDRMATAFERIADALEKGQSK